MGWVAYGVDGVEALVWDWDVGSAVRTVAGANNHAPGFLQCPPGRTVRKASRVFIFVVWLGGGVYCCGGGTVDWFGWVGGGGCVLG